MSISTSSPVSCSSFSFCSVVRTARAFFSDSLRRVSNFSRISVIFAIRCSWLKSRDLFAPRWGRSFRKLSPHFLSELVELLLLFARDIQFLGDSSVAKSVGSLHFQPHLQPDLPEPLQLFRFEQALDLAVGPPLVPSRCPALGATIALRASSAPPRLGFPRLGFGSARIGAKGLELFELFGTEIQFLLDRFQTQQSQDAAAAAHHPTMVTLRPPASPAFRGLCLDRGKGSQTEKNRRRYRCPP